MLNTVSHNSKSTNRGNNLPFDINTITKGRVLTSLNKVRFIFTERIYKEIVDSIEILSTKYQTYYKKKFNENGELRAFISEQIKKKKPQGEYMVNGEILESLYVAGKRDEILSDIGFDILFIGYNKQKKSFYASLLYSQFILQSKKQKNVKNLDGLIKKIKKKKKFKKGN